VDPGIRDRDAYELRLRLLRALGCIDRFLFATADLCISSLRGWSASSDFYESSLWEHAKYRAGSDEPKSQVQARFDGWRRQNTKRVIGLMRRTEISDA
jgi:hypothetical protein